MPYSSAAWSWESLSAWMSKTVSFRITVSAPGGSGDATTALNEPMYGPSESGMSVTAMNANSAPTAVGAKVPKNEQPDLATTRLMDLTLDPQHVRRWRGCRERYKSPSASGLMHQQGSGRGVR